MHSLSLTADSLVRHRSHLPLAPQVEKTSPPRPQDVSAVSISTTSPILSIFPEGVSLAAYRTLGDQERWANA